MANPTKAVQNAWKTEGGQDYIQFVSETGTVQSWIDSTGTGQGNLAAGGTIGGSIATGQIAVGSSSNHISGSANLTYSAGFLQLTSTAGADITDQSSSGLTLSVSGSGTGPLTIRTDASSASGINIENDGTGGSSGVTIQNTAAGDGGVAILDNSPTAGITLSETGNSGIFLVNTGSGPLSLQTGAGGLTMNGSPGFSHASSDFTAFTFTNGILVAATTSDERLKTDIKPFTTGLDAVLKINPITFRWNKETSNMVSDHEWVGFSAQNIQTVIPVATPMGEDGYLEFNDKGVLGATVNAIKELYAIIQTQNDRIKVLEDSSGI